MYIGSLVIRVPTDFASCSTRDISRRYTIPKTNSSGQLTRESNKNFPFHHNDVTWVSWHLKSLADRYCFNSLFVQANIREIINVVKAPIRFHKHSTADFQYKILSCVIYHTTYYTATSKIERWSDLKFKNWNVTILIHQSWGAFVNRLKNHNVSKAPYIMHPYVL